MDDKIIDSELVGEGEIVPETSERHAKKVSLATERIISGMERFTKKTGLLKLGESSFWTESAKTLREAGREGGAVDILDSFWEILTSMPEAEEEV